MVNRVSTSERALLAVRDLYYLKFGPFGFELAAGECVGLTGPSGAGKSRMLRSLADLDPHEGAVLLEGDEATGIPAPAWRRQVGYLPAESRWWHDRVGEHFSDLGQGEEHGLTLDALGFAPDVLSWSVGRLSTGERQRLALLRLLLNNPRVLLLDEPTSGLDLTNAAGAESLLAGYRERTGAAVLWVSHDAAQLGRVASRILYLAEGRLGEST